MMSIESDIIRICTSEWKLDDLENIIDDFESLITNMNIKNSDLFIMTIVGIIRKSILTMREIIILCRHGLANGAFSLSRNVYEQYILLCFFLLHKDDDDFEDILEDYDLDSQVQLWKIKKEECIYFFPEERKEMDKELEELKALSHHCIDLSKDCWWAGKKNITGLAKDVEAHKVLKKIDYELKVYYKASCRFLHANSYGNLFSLGEENEDNVIDLSITIVGQKTPLCFSTMAMKEIISHSLELFSIDYSELNYKLTELNNYYSQHVVYSN